MKKIRFLLGSTLNILLLAVIAFIVLYFDYQRFLKTPIVGADSPPIYVVEPGDSILKLIQDFPKYNIVLASNSSLTQLPIPKADKLGAYYFRYLASSHKKTHKIKVGSYEIKEGMKPLELLNTLTSGKTISYRAQFIEGRTFKEMREILASNPNIEYTLGDMSDEEIMVAMGETVIHHPEGMFFPDTYQFLQKDKDIDVLKKSYNLMHTNLMKAWSSRYADISLKTPYELLILASIIEKETGVNSERERVSGVFHRRLDKNMRLQTDPSVVYGLGDEYDGKIYKSDLKKDTPYNTYVHKGLPPTPIAMPGFSSLMAAGQPDDSDALFFVADGRGGHTFSVTLKEHNRAVQRYRKSLKK